MLHEPKSAPPFALTTAGLTGLGAVAAVAILAWPRPAIEPGGVPTVAFLTFVPIVRAIYAVALAAVFALPAAVISLVLRERWTAVVVLVALVDAAALVLAGALLTNGTYRP